MSETVDDIYSSHPRSWIDAESEKLLNKALSEISEFYRIKAMEDRAFTHAWQRGKLGVRARQNKSGVGITIEWFVQRFQANPNGRKGGQVFSDSLKRGRGSAVPDSALPRSGIADWEREMFRDLEDRVFAPIRIASNSLGKLSFSLGKYEGNAEIALSE